jgi:uncharacterized protein (TIGR02265 family)
MHPNPVVFNTCVEGLFVRGLGTRMTVRCRERLREAGLDLDRLEPTYPLARWKEFVHIAARELYPGLTHDEACWKLGEHFMEGFLQTFIGRTIIRVLRVLGPRRALQRLGQNLRAGNNFSEFRMAEHGPGDVEVWLNDTFANSPAFAAALIARGHAAYGARNVRVQTVQFDGAAALLRIRWDEG